MDTHQKSVSRAATAVAGEAPQPNGSDQRRSAALGIALMAGSMLIIPSSDAIAKYLSGAHSAPFLSWARYVAALGFLLPVVAIAQWRSPEPLIAPGQLMPQIIRTAFLVSAMTLYYMAIRHVPLADALGAYFVAPIVATLLATLILRERLDWRRLAAVGLGFGGALLVVRPGAETSSGTLIALASGALMACYLVMTRATAKASSPLSTLTLQLALGIAMLTPFVIFQWSMPDREGIMLILLMGLISAASNLMTISAFRFAQVSTLSPLVYLELVGATALGLVIFGDFPAPATWAGIAVIVIAGLLESPDAGEVFIGGVATSQLDDKGLTRLRRTEIGFVYQFHHLLPEFTALENVVLPQRIRGLARGLAEERASELLTFLGLGERLDHLPGELSGGEQQRVAIGRAVANGPRLLLADEPTGNLDPQTAQHVFGTLMALARASGLAALIATHSLDLARQMDRQVTIRDGLVVKL